MALELRQQLKLTQQLIMTPQLQMAIKLLQLSRLELVDMIRQEMEENPILEEAQEVADDEQPNEKYDTNPADTPSIKEVTVEEKINDDIDWSVYFNDYSLPVTTHSETERKETPSYESFIAPKESLREHLLWQLLMTSLSAEEENIGSLIVGNLTQAGYLSVSVEELAMMSDSEPDKVEQVLSLLQTFDPIGVCSRNLSECLLIQAKHLGLDNSIVTEIIKNHLNHLENSNYKAICKALKVRLEHIVSAVNIIKGLEPMPGRQFSDDQTIYITPDIFVYKMENDFVIVLNDDGMPKLRVSAYYKKIVNRGETIPDNVKDYIQEKMRSAAWLIRSIHQRQKTIYKVMESILGFQREFFEKGIEYLKPLVLRDVAEDIGMHESTISRVTTNKYSHTPQGIFELKYFFNSSIKRVHGEAIAAASVQNNIRRIIESEDPRKPYSDDKISKLLKEANIDIARRTVAKYREILRVLPSNKRKQL